MPLNIESLDDPVVLDGSPSFSGGQYSNARANAIQANQFTSLLNIDISTRGSATTRRGVVAIGASGNRSHAIQALAYYNTPTVSQLVNVNNGAFEKWSGTVWSAVTSFAALAYDPTLPVQAVQGDGDYLLFLAQAGSPMKQYDGTHLSLLSGLGTMNPPLNPSLIEWHTDRLIVAGLSDIPDGISMSQYFDGNTWDHANWDIRVGSGDGEPIRAIKSWTKFDLVVAKEDSIWSINCDPAAADQFTGNISAFPVTPIHKKIGTKCPGSFQQAGGDVFFLSTSGVRSIARTLASEQQNQIGPPLSEPITDLIERINPSALGTVCSAYWNSRYMLALPLDSATYPNFVIVYNTITNSWSGAWSNWTPTAFCRRIDGGIAKLCIGHSTGHITDFNDYTAIDSEVTETFQDEGIDYATTIVSKAYDCGDPDALKSGLFARVEFNKSTATARVAAILDGSADDQLLGSVPTSAVSVTLPVTLPFTFPTGGILPKTFPTPQLGQWREYQSEITCGAGKLSVNKMSIGAFMDTYILDE